jgi:lysine 6-dehydrogenase
MHILILGAGRMAYGLVHDFLNQPELKTLHLVDQSPEAPQAIQTHFNDPRLQITRCMADDLVTLKPFFQKADGAISAVPYDYNVALTKLAIETRTHFVDLGGNNTVVEQQFDLSNQARDQNIGVIPDCGLAPGMASVVAARAVSELEKVESLKIRVGGLPVHPQGPLKYMLLFSPHGLINEYIEAAVILKDGKITTVPSMTEVETLEFPAPFGTLEAFYTSGGTSTLPQTYAGIINTLNYKTIRYPGHCHIFKAMLDLGFASDETIRCNGGKRTYRDVFEEMLIKPFSYEGDDVTLVRVTAEGHRNGRRETAQYQCIDYFDHESGLTAMMRTTAFPATILLQMLIRGQIKDRGVLRQELSVPGALFMDELTKRRIIFERNQ